MPSTVISSFHYDEQTATLEVIFLTGSVYKYLHVPKKIFEAMKKATSKGSYLNRYIKGNFNYEKIK